MKNYFLLAVLCLIFSCKSNTKHSSKDSSLIANNTESPNLLIAKFKPLLQGTWIKKAYIDKIAKTKSPLAAVDEAIDITAFSINTANIKGDSIIIPVGWDNHEGSDLTLSFKKGKRSSSLIFGAGELKADVDHGDTIITIYYPNGKNRVKAAQFIRANSQKIIQIGDGMSRLVNKVLIAGTYALKDTTINTAITFNIDGQLNGFKNFKNYSINFDLNVEPMDNLDEISFISDNKTHQSYSFKFDSDTLKLYDTKPNADSSLLVLDKLRYKLVKLK